MHPIAKYAAVSGLLLVTACGVCVLGFSLAGERFATVPSPSASETETIASVRATKARPQSTLLGSDPQRVAREAAARQSWVEVVDAVNMRQGPSSANAVIRVQLAGTKLRVASREGKWVEVFEPDTAETGWVFDAYVKRIAPVSRRAEAAETTIR
ncbi:MAG: SH3 domain-containing protein [Methyloceanibacter sp.]|uniref:SH3 domain-containing protein n=1 Tax=Methyloceanibacter sp. TaxID=1965321 RepID=UPI003EE21094